MILINKGEENKIIVTLTENVTLDIPIYLFRIVNDVTTNEIAVILSDISDYQDRYNEFIFTEGNEITFPNLGFYHYYIYEQTSNSNLDYKNSTSLLEVGKLKVEGEESEETQSYEASDEYKSYEEQ